MIPAILATLLDPGRGVNAARWRPRNESHIAALRRRLANGAPLAARNRLCCCSTLAKAQHSSCCGAASEAVGRACDAEATASRTGALLDRRRQRAIQPAELPQQEFRLASAPVAPE